MRLRQHHDRRRHPEVIMRWISGLALGFLSIAGCASGTPSRDDGGGVFRCDADTDCNDMADCTLDSCGIGNMCTFMPLNELCPMGQTCVPGMGCVSGMPCTNNEQCQDLVMCTVDSCGADGFCRHQPIAARCTDAAAPTCDPVRGCVAASGCTSAAMCDDSIDCTVDTCGADMTCRHAPVDARCGRDQVCSAATGCRTPMPCTTPAECDDGNFCNGVERCVPEFGCAEAETPRVCNDSNDCTTDSCDAAIDRCVFPCDGSRPACMCMTTSTTCAGTFSLSPAPSQTCAFGLVSYDLSTITMTNEFGAVTVTPAAASFPALSDAVEPACPNFEATTVVDGSCRETYMLRGTFSDDDTFTGSWEARFSAAEPGACFDCGPRTVTVTGTRR